MLLFSVKLYHFSYCPLAHRAKCVGVVHAHPAVVGRAIYAVKRIAASFIKSDGILHRQVGWGRLRSAVGKHVFPFRVKVDESGYVWLPRLGIERVCVVHHVAIVKIFVGKASEAVAEFVSDNIIEVGAA